MLSAFATYTAQHATFGADLRIASQFHPLAQNAEILVQSGDRLPGVPTHSAKFGVSAALTTALSVGVNARTQSGQYLRGDEANLLARVPGFTIVHVRAAQRITRRVSVVGEVQNIFAADYYTFGVLGDAALLAKTSKTTRDSTVPDRREPPGSDWRYGSDGHSREFPVVSSQFKV